MVVAVRDFGRMREQVAISQLTDFDPREAELVSRAKERSPDAWTEIYNRHYRSIYRYVNARVFDQETTEDLSSAVFLAAIKSIDSYNYKGQPLLAWLYRIARNVVSSHQRRLLGPQHAKAAFDAPRQVISRLMRRAQPGEGELAGETIAGHSPEGDPAALVDRLDLREALGKLRPSQREIVILRFLVGLSTDEIAALMEKKPSAVYSLEARALQSLRKRLE